MYLNFVQSISHTDTKIAMYLIFSVYFSIELPVLYEIEKMK